MVSNDGCFDLLTAMMYFDLLTSMMYFDLYVVQYRNFTDKV